MLINVVFIHFFAGTKIINNYDELSKWILSREVIIHLQELWFATHGCWDDKDNVS